MLKYTIYCSLDMPVSLFAEAYKDLGGISLKNAIHQSPIWCQKNINVESLSDASYIAYGWVKHLEDIRNIDFDKKQEDGSFVISNNRTNWYCLIWDHQKDGFVIMHFE